MTTTEKKYIRKVVKVGHSLAIIIPKTVVVDLRVIKGTTVLWRVQGENVTLRKFSISNKTEMKEDIDESK